MVDEKDNILQRAQELYREIHQICLMNFIEMSGRLEDNLYPKIINKCSQLLAKLEKDELGGDELYFNEQDCCTGLSEEIRKAYRAVWREGDLSDDEVYFLSSPRAKLLDWDKTQSPYKELQKASSLFMPKQRLGGCDVVVMFEELLKVLENKNSSIKKLECEVSKIFLEYSGFFEDKNSGYSFEM